VDRYVDVLIESFTTLHLLTSDIPWPLQTLDSLLLMPIQRIPRYTLLLADLLKCTPSAHPDHANLSQAMATILAMAQRLNDGMRRADEERRLVDITLSFPNDDVHLLDDKVCTMPVVAAAQRCMADAGMAQHTVALHPRERPRRGSGQPDAVTMMSASTSPSSASALLEGKIDPACGEGGCAN